MTVKPFGMWKNIEFLKEVDSTNNYLKQNKKIDTVVFAQRQTCGRGRRGRTWLSEETDNIYMSAAFKPDILPEKAGILSLAAGLAAAQTAEFFGADCKIKWPNDLVCRGRKLGGILTESVENGKFYVTGIGINMANKNFPKEISEKATSMFIETKKHTEKMVFAEKLLERLDFWFSNLEKTVPNYKKRCITIGSRVRVIGAAEEYNAAAVDIDASGALVVETNGKILTVNSGEVSVRGIYGYV